MLVWYDFYSKYNISILSIIGFDVWLWALFFIFVYHPGWACSVWGIGNVAGLSRRTEIETNSFY